MKSELWTKMTRLLCFGYALIIWPTIGDKRTWDCVKKPFQVIDLLYGFIPCPSPPPPHSSQQWCGHKKDSFPPMVLKIQLCLGCEEEGSLVLLISLETGPNTFDLHCTYFCIQLLQFWQSRQQKHPILFRENNCNIPLFTLGKHNLRVKKPNWLGAN